MWTMSAHYKPYRNDPDTECLDWSSSNGDNDMAAAAGAFSPNVRMPTRRWRKRRLPGYEYMSVAYTLIAVFIGIVFGLVVGYFAAKAAAVTNSFKSSSVLLPLPSQVKFHNKSDFTTKDHLEVDETMFDSTHVTRHIIETVSAENIRSYLRKFSRRPHLAGTVEDLAQADEIRDLWRGHGLDRVDMVSYNVLLSYPDPNRPSTVRVLNDRGHEMFRSRDKEIDAVDVVTAYGAYSPSGIIQGDVVYCNYGLSSDFAFLTDKLKLNLTGKIIMMRLGMLFMFEQVRNAQDHNASSVLLYPDPQDFIPPSNRNFVYPSTWWLPGNAIPRGTVASPPDGDPLTPGYPATDFAARLSVKEAPGLPRIPVHVIGYGDAHFIISRLGGKKAPPTWQGGLNVTYNVGPGFTLKNWTFHMEVHTSNKMRRTHNVIGYIRGSVEPDRYVLVGNHRDAWAYGAADPSAGTAILVELSRTFGLLLQKGWRPRRTLVFCSWGAEEFNLIGSTEWLEEHIKVLQERAVTYINVDIAVTGNHSLSVSASPLLHKAIYEVTQNVPNPNPTEIVSGRPTVYDTWLKTHPNNRNSTAYFLHSLLSEGGDRLPKSTFLREALEGVRPRVRKLHGNADYSAFFNRAGIPSLDLTYTYIYPGAYPLYHTAFDNFRTVETFVDPTFKYHQAVGQTVGDLIRDLVDSTFLPFNVFHYAQVMKDLLESMQLHLDLIPQFKKDLNDHHVEIEWLDAAIQNFTRAALDFHTRQEKADITNPLDVRKINDQLMLLERAFLDPQGLPGQPLNRHIIQGPSRARTFGDDSFPGLVDLLANAPLSKDPMQKWSALRQHLGVLVFTVQSAANTLAEVV